jgi:hypothetical protein
MSEAQGYHIAGTPSSGNGAAPNQDSGHVEPEGQDSSQGRPEIAVGAAFLGGFLLAVLLRRARS